MIVATFAYAIEFMVNCCSQEGCLGWLAIFFFPFTYLIGIFVGLYLALTELFIELAREPLDDCLDVIVGGYGNIWA